MPPVTEMIDMRTPATAPIPVITEAAWSEVVAGGQLKRPRRHRKRGRDPLELVGDVLTWGGWLGLVTWLGTLAFQGQLTFQALPWGP